MVKTLSMPSSFVTLQGYKYMSHLGKPKKAGSVPLGVVPFQLILGATKTRHLRFGKPFASTYPLKTLRQVGLKYLRPLGASRFLGRQTGKLAAFRSSAYVDGVDILVQEERPLNKQLYSHKFKHAGYDTKLQLLWVPQKSFTFLAVLNGSWPDLKMVRESLLPLLEQDEMMPTKDIEVTPKL
ncbi:hypothetical protein BC829DRAFT_415677 [Chytridium lagenaria]|nr:hypothetical protein BC829DRAFT_415677 [Chytridium lagenaria]